ncbi:helix-turn-helix domain-containing protein [Mobilicoccus massiliensis]|uniref:helix-turn-helix domain-containing protein n=1 Tax=Mobilicoccus massiliensis TaxID=1522310 RepID=UPI0036F429FA
MSTKEAARFLDVEEVTMRAWRARRRGPTFHRIGGRYVYMASDVLAWARANDR